MRILILASHPDDECLGAGGTIARLAAEGHSIAIRILGAGLTSRGPTNTSELTNIRATAGKVGRHLGADVVLMNDAPLPDNAFDTVALLEVAKEIEKAITVWQPEIVYTQHGGDLNMDHVITYRATMIATRPLPGVTVKEVYAYEVPSSTECAFGRFAPAFQPTTFVDISGEYLERKIQAMEMYESERRTFPHPRSPEALRALAMWRGAQSGLMAAEAFELVRSIR